MTEGWLVDWLVGLLVGWADEDEKVGNGRKGGWVVVDMGLWGGVEMGIGSCCAGKRVEGKTWAVRVTVNWHYLQRPEEFPAVNLARTSDPVS